jgi:hypothetical protein
LTSVYDSQTSKQTQCNNLDNEFNNAMNDREAKVQQSIEFASK